MSNLVFPALPGLKWDVKRIPQFKTLRQESVSGKELRAALMSFPLYKYSLEYEVLRADTVNLELQKLMGFFLSHQGSFDSFLFNDTNDNTVTDQNFGTGDGSSVNFQLVRTFGAGGFTFNDPVQSVNAITNIKKNGVTQTLGVDYTVGSTGIITFTVAPTLGHALTWTGTYYWRVRFVHDTMEFNEFMRQLWNLKRCELLTVKL